MYRLFLLLCLWMTLALQAESFPHLILHFDVNKTLIASDKTENKSIEDVINELLSRKYSACWDENVEEPITFDAYVRTVLLPGDEHNVRLKMERLVHLTHFSDYLREHNHPLYETVLKELTLVLDALKKAQGNVFPSFYHLIAELNQRGISYTLFLRSFGKEVFEVKNEINSICQDLFKIEGIFQKGILYIAGKSPLSDPQAIYHFFSSREHAAIRDDWKYWMEREMYAKYGKLLYVDPADTTVLTLFFDDNIKLDSPEKNIIAPINPKTKEFLSIPALIQSKQLIPVDTLEAILNERYFIEYIDEALRMHVGHRRV